MSLIKIVLDAGHGMNTSGKRTPDGEREWSFNNKVANFCEERLNQYGKFEIMRVDDITGNTDVPLITRTNKANKWNADLYFAIHQNANAGKWGSHGGTETFYYSSDSKGKKIAQLVQDGMVSALGLRNRGIKVGDHLHVIRETKMTALLSEGAFMDSTTDIKVLRNDEDLKKQGYAIADGIAKSYGFDLTEHEVKSVHKSITEMELDYFMKFSSPTLKTLFENRIDSKATDEIIDKLCVEHLGYQSKLNDKGRLEHGDKYAMLMELAVALYKSK